MVKFIAEVSSNHAQDLGRSLAFVDAAAACGFDAVKFQLFRVAELFAPEILAKSPQHKKRVAWELPLAHLEPIANRCREKSIEFSCTPFYLEAVRQLEPYVAFYKVASYELLWNDLLKACAATGKPVEMITGFGDHARDPGRGCHAGSGESKRHHRPALRLGLSVAAGTVEPVGHCGHPQGNWHQDRLVGPFAVACGDRTGGPSLECLGNRAPPGSGRHG